MRTIFNLRIRFTGGQKVGLGITGSFGRRTTCHGRRTEFILDISIILLPPHRTDETCQGLSYLREMTSVK